MTMNVIPILQELKRERDQLNEAIAAMVRLATSMGPRRGRPPKWLAAAVDTLPEKVPAKKKAASA